MRIGLFLLTLALSFVFFCHPADAATGSVDYVVRFGDRANNLVDVEATFPTGIAREVTLFMPVWTPGSYLVREFSRNVQELGAWAGERALTVEKVAKNRWRVRSEGAREITVRYRLFARELSVRTNYVDQRYAILNGAATFITRVDGMTLPHTVRVDVPSDWSGAASGMPSPAPNVFRARDYEHLVDSPIVAGNLDIRKFEVGSKPHYIVSFGDLRFADLAQIAKDIEAVTRQTFVFWRDMPYENYWFLNAMVEASGGLEHENSTLIMTNRFLTRSRNTYRSWIETVSHEIFHVWNVKEMRPAELVEIDYETEAYTRALWFAEGFTDYYGALLARRAGVITPDEYLASLSQQIRSVQTSPGRALQTAEQASFDAWIRFYRPDENSPNVSVSYYTKGHVIAFVLDAAIRNTTAGQRSLDDVMRRVYQTDRQRGFTRESLERAVAELGSAELVQLIRDLTSETKEIDYSIPFALYGLRFRDAPTSADLGAITLDSSGRLLIRTPLRDGAAWNAGLQSDDEILAIDGVRVLPGELNERLGRYTPGTDVEILISRRGTLMTFPVTLGSTESLSWNIEVRSDATRGQHDARREWSN